MRSMKALIRQLDEVKVPEAVIKARKVVPKVDPVLKAAEALAQAVRALKAKREEMAGIRPLMHYEVDVPRKDYEATWEATQAHTLFLAQAAVAEAYKQFEAVWDAWSL